LIVDRLSLTINDKRPTKQYAEDIPMNRSYFTIAEIMLVIAIAAIFLAGFRVVAQDEAAVGPIRELMILRAISGTVIGALIGIGIGKSRRRWIIGIIWGLVVGSISGFLAATLLSIPQNVTLAIVGAAVLVVGGIVVRLLSRHAPNDPEQ
jgi:peptidoglycan/LPS O-acetylase OafA/YrhL